MRVFASGSLCAMPAISDSMKSPASWPSSAIRGSACITAKLVIGTLAAIFCASAIPFARPCPACSRYVESPSAWPSSAEYTRPVNIMSAMRCAPMIRGRRTEPPPPTKMPRCASGNA